MLFRSRVLARGSHAELLAGTPGYAHLVTAYADAERERVRERAAELADAEVPA